VNRVNGHADDGQSNVFPQTPSPEVLSDATSAVFAADPMKEPATRAKQRAKRQIHQNRFVIVGAGSVITALLLFAAVSMPHLGAPRKAKHEGARVTGKLNPESTDASNDKSLFPIIDVGRPGNKNDHSGFLSERDLQRSVIRRVPKTTQSGRKNPAETLRS